MLVVDFGAQYAQLIARRVREAGVYSEIVPHTHPPPRSRRKNPVGIILSGGPSSVYEAGAPALDAGVFDLGVPDARHLLRLPGDGAGARRRGRQHRPARVRRDGCRAHRRRRRPARRPAGRAERLDEPRRLRSRRRPRASTCSPRPSATPVAAFGTRRARLYGVQWHPEVKHTDHGQRVIENFLHQVAGLPADLEQRQRHRRAGRRASARRSATGRVICGLSGGVDSAVAAALVHGPSATSSTCVFVDHGLLRKGEREQVERDYVAATGVRLVTCRRARAVPRPRSPASATRSRSARSSAASSSASSRRPRPALVAEAAADGEPIRFLVQGTLYPDVVESGGGTGTANIKSHHNVGGLPEDLQFELVEPLRTLFKDEVRAIGRELGLPEAIVGRQPFPGPGLGIRIVGEVTASASRFCATPTRSRARS